MKPVTLTIVVALASAEPVFAAKPPSSAQPRTVFTAESALESRGAKVRFEDLLDTAVAWWVHGAASPKGGCVYTVHALPVRPTALAWQGTAKELVRSEVGVSGSGGCPAKAPPARVRVLGGEVWAALGGDGMVRLAGVDYDGKPSSYRLPPYPGEPGGAVDLFRIEPFIVLRADKAYFGWKLETPAKEAMRLKGLSGNVVGAVAAGWVMTADGAIQRVEDPAAPAAGKPLAKIPPAPAADPPLVAEDGQDLVVVTCGGGVQPGVFRVEGAKGKPRRVFSGRGMGCPRAARVTEDGRVLVASLTTGKDGKREAAHITLIGRGGKPLGASLRVDLEPARDRELGLAYAGGNAILLWTTAEGDAAVVRGADFTVGAKSLEWSGSL